MRNAQKRFCGVMMLVVLLSCGCRTKKFSYPFDSANVYSEPTCLLARTLYVKTFIEQRPKARNSIKRVNYAMIPLVPFSKGSIEHPEQKWHKIFTHTMDSSRANRLPRIIVTPIRDFTDAVLYSTDKSRIFEQVMEVTDDIPGKSLVLECRLSSTRFSMSKITYGLSFMAIVPWYCLALPKGTASNELAVDLVLYNDGQEVWNHRFSKIRSRVFGGYYNKGNIFTGYAENMQSGLNASLADLSERIRREPDKFQ